MKKQLLKYRYEIILILTGIVWLTFLNELIQINNQNNICNDCDNYRESAYYLYHHFKSHYFRPIGMAIITGFPYLFNASDYTIYKFSLILNVLSWIGTSLLLFTLLKKYVTNKKAFFFTLAYLSILGSIFIIFNLLTETIFTFLIIVSFYFLKKYNKNKAFLFLSLSISIFLFTILIKPSIKFFAIIVFLYFGKTILKNYKNRSIVFIYLSLLLIAFQYIKMKKDYGNYTLTYIDSVTYYNYLGSKAMCYKTNDIFSQETNNRAKFLEQFSYPEQRNIATKDFLSQLNDNKFNLLKSYISNLLENMKTPSSSCFYWKNLNHKDYFEKLKTTVNFITKYQNRILSVLGFFLSIFYILKSYKTDKFLFFISCYILYTITISGVSCSQGDRFHIVFYPFVIILFAKFYTDLKTKPFILKNHK